MSKKEVLSVYRRILRVARTWRASSGLAKDTLEERNYIASECRELFRQNSEVFQHCLQFVLVIFSSCLFCARRNINRTSLI